MSSVYYQCLYTSATSKQLYVFGADTKLHMFQYIPGSGTAAQDVVVVSDNPAYQQITVQRIEMKENTAYHTVHLPAASPQYENIPQVGVVGEDEVGSKRET